MKIVWEKNFIIFVVVFSLSIIVYIFSEAILRRNTLSAAKVDQQNQTTEYGRLVDWLPASWKLTIEYRAKYLDYQDKVEKARSTDAKVDAIFVFADYIKVKDKELSDKRMAEVALNPEYYKSRRAYKALAKLLLSDNPHKRLTIKEYHDYINNLTWEEDKYHAWSAGLTQLNILKVKTSVYLEYYQPLLDNPEILTNYARFYTDLGRRATALKNTEIADQVNKIQDQIKKAKLAINNNLLNAPLDFRRKYVEYKKDIETAKDADSRLSAIITLAGHMFNYKNSESIELFSQVYDKPEYTQCPNYYYLLSKMLVERRLPKRLNITVKQYQEYIATLQSDSTILHAWEAGLSQLVTLKQNAKTIVAYLKPLLDTPPKYKEYKILYEQLRDKAIAAEDQETADKASAILEKIESSSDIKYLERSEF